MPKEIRELQELTNNEEMLPRLVMGKSSLTVGCEFFTTLPVT